jgi:prophage regulatory protein
MAARVGQFEPLEKILRLSEVESYVGLKRSCIYKLINAGGFPRQIQLTSRSVGWRNTEVQKWIYQREVAHGQVS